MLQNLDEAVAAIRSAQSLEELKSLVDETCAPKESDSQGSASEESRKSAGTVEYLWAGLVMAVSGLASVFAYFAFWISLVCLVYWLWQVDVTGIVRSLLWVAGSFVVLAAGSSVAESRESWLRQHRAPWIRKPIEPAGPKTV